MAITLIIADKDIQAAEALQDIIAETAPDMEVVGCFRDGLSAWNHLKTYRPDAIIAEIDLPGMDIFQIIRLLDQSQIAARALILSEQRSFASAQQAVNDGAYAYLTKPAKPGEIATALERLRQACAYEINIQKGTTLYAVSLLMQGGVSAKWQFDHWNFFKDLSNQRIRLCLVQFDQPQGYDQYQTYMKIPATWAYYLRPLWINEYYWIIIYKDAVFSGAPRLGTLMLPFGKVKYHAAFSDPFDCTQFPQAYSQAREAVLHAFYQPEQQIFSCHEVQPFHTRETSLFIQSLIESQFSARINQTRGDSALETICMYFSGAQEEWIHPDLLCAELKDMFLYLRNSKGYLSQEVEKLITDALSFLEILGNLKYYLDFNTLRERILSYINQLILLCEPVEPGSTRNQIVRKVQYYCEKHYSEEISLKIITQEVHVTKSWFCTLFKEETGQTFGNYLTGLRMHNAQIQLITTQKKVRQIAAEVGYKNPNHFNHVFMQQFGVTPLEYRKAHGRSLLK